MLQTKADYLPQPLISHRNKAEKWQDSRWSCENQQWKDLILQLAFASVLGLVDATIEPVEAMGNLGAFPLLLEGISPARRDFPQAERSQGRAAGSQGWLARRRLLLESHSISFQPLMSPEGTLSNLVLPNSLLLGTHRPHDDSSHIPAAWLPLCVCKAIYDLCS